MLRIDEMPDPPDPRLTGRCLICGAESSLYHPGKPPPPANPRAGAVAEFCDDCTLKEIPKLLGAVGPYHGFITEEWRGLLAIAESAFADSRIYQRRKRGLREAQWGSLPPSRSGGGGVWSVYDDDDDNGVSGGLDFDF